MWFRCLKLEILLKKERSENAPGNRRTYLASLPGVGEGRGRKLLEKFRFSDLAFKTQARLQETHLFSSNGSVFCFQVVWERKRV